MTRAFTLLALLLVAASSPCRAEPPPAPTLEQVEAAFRARSGARLVFTADRLPRGSYHARSSERGSHEPGARLTR